MLRYISYVLSVGAAFSFGTSLVLLRDIVPSDRAHPKHEIVQDAHSTGATPMDVVPMASQLIAGLPEATPSAQVASAALSLATTSDQMHENARHSVPVALAAPDPLVLPEALDPVAVDHTFEVATQGELSSVQDTTSAPEPVAAALPTMGHAAPVSLHEAQREIATRSVGDVTLKTGSIEPRALSRRHTTPARTAIRSPEVVGDGREQGDRSLHPVALGAPVQAHRSIRRAKQSPAVTFVSLPSASPQEARSSNERSSRAVLSERVTQTQLPHALRPLPGGSRQTVTQLQLPQALRPHP